MRLIPLALLQVFLIFIISGCLDLTGRINNTYALENALQQARSFDGTNEDWTPFEYNFDGVLMVMVPVGCFMMGSEDGEWDEVPVHEICFENPFWIDKYEVTNDLYGSIGCAEYSSTPTQPRNCIDWREAYEFCASRMMRLPTEAEWEYSARGPDSLRYPWGNNWENSNAVNAHNSSSTAEVGIVLSGISWVGAFDLSGNVWEWTSSKNMAYPYSNTDGREIIDQVEGRGRQIRGGSWNNGSDYLRAANRGGNDTLVGIDIGFRCATDS